MRLAHKELCYEYAEFKQLSAPAICRRYALGDDWVDKQADESAEKLAFKR